MAKSTPNLGEISGKVYALLESLEDSDRAKVLNSVHGLFGQEAPASRGGGTVGTGVAGVAELRQLQAGQSTPQKFYSDKSPQNKGEMLAVAARYREQHGQGEHHTVEDFAAYFTAARQNFDRRNFPRDIKNAQRQASLFNTGGPRGQYQLAYYGQQYVDALPDREAVKKLRRPGRNGTLKKRASR